MLSKKALSIKPSPTTAVDSRAKEMKSQGIDVIGLGSGEPDFDTPFHILEAAVTALNEGHTRYTTASGNQELKEAICKKFKADNGLEYSPPQIVISNGAKQSIDNTLAALLNPGDEVMIPAPYWVSYPEMVKLNDGIPVPVRSSEDNLFKVTPADLDRALTDKTRVLIINSPVNPTGQVYSEEELKAIADFCCERNIYMISDEIYEKLIYSGCPHVSIASFNKRAKELTVVVNGASKSYAMTGWRVGYTASAPEIASVMAAVQSHTTGNVNSIAQKAALAALQGPQECVEKMRLAFDERRRYIYKNINKIAPLRALEPMGTFYIFTDLAGVVGMSFSGQKISGSDSFAKLLLESKQVAVVPGTGFGAPNHIRLSFATTLDGISEGLKRIEAFIGELE